MAAPTKGPRSRTSDGPDLFEFAATQATTAVVAAPVLERAARPAPVSKKAVRPLSAGRTEMTVSTVSVEAMPTYPDELHRAVERSLAELPSDKVWFTYRDIKRHFGVSRATVARRVKDGLVPGIRRQRDRVLDDGAVRRFDRVQLHWLLLAVRFARNSE